MVNEVLAEGGSLGALRPGGELGMVGGKEKRGGEGPRTRERGIEASLWSGVLFMLFGKLEI